MIRTYLRDVINNHKTLMELIDKVNINDTKFKEWNIPLVMLNNCISSKDFQKTRSIYSVSNPVKIFMGSDTENIIDKLFNAILQRFQEAGETSKERGSEFIHESVGLLYYYFHKTDMKRAASYIMSHKWLRSKGATINPKNKKDYKCFQYVIIISLNYQNIGNDPQIISKLKPFINQYNWKGIEFPLCQKDWKKFEQYNMTITLNILFVPQNTKTIRLAYKSDYNNEHENQVILLMITDGKNGIILL